MIGKTTIDDRTETCDRKNALFEKNDKPQRSELSFDHVAQKQVSRCTFHLVPKQSVAVTFSSSEVHEI